MALFAFRRTTSSHGLRFSSKSSYSTKVLPLLPTCTILILLVSAAAIVLGEEDPSTKIIPANFTQTYNGTINSNITQIFQYSNIPAGKTVRVHVESEGGLVKRPLLVVVREVTNVLSWRIPFILQPNFTFSAVSRSLCPVKEDDEAISVGLSTASSTPVNYILRSYVLPSERFNVNIGSDLDVSASPSEPYFLKFKFPDHVDSVIVNVQGYDTLCMILSIQPISCPVNDLDNNVNFAGTYQTATKKAAIPILKRMFPEFYVVVVIRGSDKACIGMDTLIPTNPVSGKDREKNVTVTIEESLNNVGYAIALSATVSVLLAVYLVACLLSVGMDRYDEKQRRSNNVDPAEYEPLNHGGLGVNYDAIETPVSSNNINASINGVPSASPATAQEDLDDDDDADEIRRRNEDVDYDTLDDLDKEKRIVRSKQDLKVHHLAMKPWKQRDKKYRLYHWNLMTISVFYVLPVIQLVLAYQAAVFDSGNEDLCYYNFLCARPLFSLFAFNNVFSNIGYVGLGILFLILVHRRDKYYFAHFDPCHSVRINRGLPRHFGLFYSIGIALVMEGILSGCYHVCPNYTNFQFDTAFMFFIGALGMLQIYQMRHPDINANSHVSFAIMAGVILLSVIGVVANGLAFWIIFSILYMLLVVVLGAEFYYKGEWSLGSGVLLRARNDIRGQGASWIKPTYPDRIISLVIIVMLNFAFVILGLVNQPKDFGSFMLAIFISNLLMYVAYYVIMKLSHREKIHFRPIMFMTLAGVCWTVALYFFFSDITDWTLTPALSREKNEGCILMSFYDSHDIWHFVSAGSLFLSFMVLLSIDDDLTYTPVNNIAVF